MRIRLFGGFRVSVGPRIVGEKEWRLRKAGSLVKLLALAREHRLHRERAMDLLWPILDAKAAANNLHRALHFARRTLEPAPAPTTSSRYLALQGDLLTLCPDGPLWVDVEAFESAAATARHGREPGANRAAIDLYAGDLLPEDRYESWSEDKRYELRTVYLALLVELAAIYEERGDPGSAIEALQKVVADERTHEEAHSGLMRLYATKGHRQKALLQYGRLQKALSEDLDTGPDTQSRRLHEEIMAGRFPRACTESRPPEAGTAGEKHNLPNAHSSFVGREQEMVEVKRSLAMTQLLTLTGIGGCGKTRLALEVAKNLAGAYPDGVWLVELAPIHDPELVPQAVATALDVREQPGRSLTETLSDHLKARQMLLLLDNCEHLIEACARLVDTLLSSCERLRILATSREVLRVAGEANWLVLPLALPADAERLLPVESLTRYEAIGLFLDRARSKLPTFSLSPQNAGAVVRVCRKLDGIPLAIELAAARVTALAVEQVAERLDDSLKLLTSGNRTADPRHRTLRATLEWSYELLSEPEKELFGRLSTFAGGWTLEGAEAVGAGSSMEEDDVLDLLGRLVEKSLVMAEASPGVGGALRYRMLEPVRQYGRELLGESREEEQARDRHARYYLTLVEAAELELMGPRQVAWLERLEAERGNLRAALSWYLDEGAEPGESAQMGLRLAAALGRFWSAYGPGEGRRWLERGLARSGAEPTSLRAKALGEAGLIAVYQGDPQSIALLEESLALSKELGDKMGVAFSIGSLGHAMAHLGDRERMRTLREEAEALLREPLDRRAAAYLLLFLGIAAHSGGDHEQVAPRSGEALALFRELGDIRGAAMCLTVAGTAALEQGDFGRAAEMFEEDLRLLRELRDKVGIVFGLIGMAGVAALRGQLARASRLWGAAETLREVISLPLTAVLATARYDYEGYLAAARAGLDEATFDAAWSEGRAMSPEQAIEYALGTEEPAPPAATASRRTPGTLTRREREVATLIAQGLTNRQIAAELVISERTVGYHVGNILRKSGLRSRTRIAAWMVEQRLLSEEDPT